MSTRRTGALRAGGAVAQILMGTLIGQGSVVLISPILTHMYTAIDFGVLALVTAISAVIGAFSSLAFEAAVPIAESREQAGILMVLGLLSVTGISIIMGIVTFVLRDNLDRWFGTLGISTVWWLIPFTVAAVGIFNVMSSWLIRQQEFTRIGVRNAVQGLIQSVSAVALGLIFARSGVGLSSSVGVGRLTGGLVASIGSAKAIRDACRLWRDPVFKTTLSTFRRFPLVLSWSRLVNGLGLQLPVLLIGWWYGAFELGLFALMIRVLAGPVGMLTDAVAQFFEGTFARRLAADMSLRSLVIMTSATMFAMAIIPVVVIYVAAPEIFAVIFGDQWRVSGELARSVAIMFVFQLAVSPISRALPLLQRQGTQVAWDLSRLVVVSAAILIPAASGVSLTTTLWYMSVAQSVSYLAVFLLVLIAVDRKREKANA